MKQLEKIKQNISECESSMEMIGILDGIKADAVIYCKDNCPTEVFISKNGKVEDVSICGMVEFLESDIEINV